MDVYDRMSPRQFLDLDDLTIHPRANDQKKCDSHYKLISHDTRKITQLINSIKIKSSLISDYVEFYLATSDGHFNISVPSHNPESNDPFLQLTYNSLLTYRVFIDKLKTNHKYPQLIAKFRKVNPARGRYLDLDSLRYVTLKNLPHNCHVDHESKTFSNEQILLQIVQNNQKKHKRLNIPPAIRREIWLKYCGDVFNGHCYCCKSKIDFTDFHAAHIVADKDGGLPTTDNLVPTCAGCNLYMGTMNLREFKSRYFPDPKSSERWCCIS